MPEVHAVNKFDTLDEPRRSEALRRLSSLQSSTPAAQLPTYAAFLRASVSRATLVDVGAISPIVHYSDVAVYVMRFRDKLLIYLRSILHRRWIVLNKSSSRQNLPITKP
jgi:hypothetical protein